MSVIDKLLARIKGLAKPIPAPTVTEHAEAHIPEPVTAVLEAPPHEEALAAAAPTPVREAPTLVDEAPTLVDEAPTLVDEAPTAVDEVPIVVEEARTVVEESAPETTQPTLPLGPAGGLTLRLESERGPRSTFEVTKSGATIGRGPESTIQLADLSVSRKHAKITYKQGAYWVSDLGSMGGTWIDGAKLAAPRRVAMGQTIDIGLCRLTVVAAAEGEKSGAVKGPSHAA